MGNIFNSCTKRQRQGVFVLSQCDLGLFAFPSLPVLECGPLQATAADKCRLMFFIARFLKLMGKTKEAEELFLSVENMLMQVIGELILFYFEREPLK